MIHLDTERFSIRGCVKCQICGRKVQVGEKYIEMSKDNAVYTFKVCHNCSISFSVRMFKAGKLLKEYNDLIVKVPLQERKRNMKMIKELDK